MGSILLSFGSASAECPDEPAAAVVLGGIASFGSDHAMVATPDGATWVAWVDDQCFGSLRVQRIDPDGSLLAAGGLEFDTSTGCNLRFARLAACADGSVIASGVSPQGESLTTPIQRIDAQGISLWGAGVNVSTEALGSVGGVLGLPGGDALVTWHQGTTVFVARYDVAGDAVWPQPAAIPTLSGSNKRIFALRSDDAGGAFVLWDEPGAYTRAIWMMRVTSAGVAAWAEPLLVVPVTPGSSRHTDPVAIEDGDGGIVLVWTQGAESGSTPVPLRMQRVTAAGVMLLDPQGVRVSLDVLRQFDVVARRDSASGDVLVAWRDGGFDQQMLRVQRMTLAGTRTWGDSGVDVTSLSIGGTSFFDTAWHGDTLSLFVSDLADGPDDASVKVYNVDGGGSVDAEACPISGDTPSGEVQGIAVDGELVVSWPRVPNFNGALVTQRIETGGPVLGDTNGDGVIDIGDLVNVILDWGSDGSGNGGDVNGDGTVDIGDLVTVILQWNA